MTLTVRDLTVHLGRRAILSGLDADFRAGKISAIVGPNGSGKTTLLRALTGELPVQGRVTLNGHDIHAAKGWELAAMRAVLPQSVQLAFPFSVAEVVRLGLTAGESAQDASIVAAALARVDLTGHADRAYQDLSGGEQQRAQLARVLAQVWVPVRAGVPRWLLLDEPVSSLDIGHQIAVMTIARDFAAAGGGVVAVMHDLNLTALFADCVVLMEQGRILASGTVPEVMTDGLLSQAYRCRLRVNIAPDARSTFLLPHAMLAR